MRHTYSVAALSWIDPRSGLPEYDRFGNPGKEIELDFILRANRFRFANLLKAFVDVNAAGKITGYGFGLASKIYSNLSYLKTKPVIYKPIRTVNPTATKVTFTQAVGCRTKAPEKIARAVGSSLHPLGGGAGELFAKLHLALPPIWSDLELVINANGQYRFRVVRHSLFPSMTTYIADQRIKTDYRACGNYDGVLKYRFWRDAGWGMTAARPLVGKGNPGNPWGVIMPGNPWGILS